MNFHKIKQGQSIVLMHLSDVVKFCNRMGIRDINDVTAQVTADVTAAMDPDGMGLHMGMGPSGAPLPLGEDGQPVLAGAPPLLSEMVTKEDFMVVVKELGGVIMQGHASSLEISQKNQTQVMGYVETINTKVVGYVETLNTQMKGYVDQELDAKGLEIEAKCLEFETKYKEFEAKFEQRLASVLVMQRKPPKKRTKKYSKLISKNISFANGSYSWRKCIKKKASYKGSYKTVGEAQQGLAQFCEENSRGAASMQD